MGFLAALREWLGGTAPDAPAPPEEPSPAAVATLEAPDDDAGPAWWVPRGAPVLAPPRAAKAIRSVDRDLYDGCVHTLEDPHYELPQLPQVAQRLLMILHGDDVDLRAAAEVAGHDAALAAELLRAANSVAYRGITEIHRLDQAFARLGQRSVRSLVVAASVKGIMIRVGGVQRTLGEELWRRSVASGVVAASLSRRCGLSDEDAFLVGLLHDIGLLAVLKVVHDVQRGSGSKVSRAVFDALAEQWHEHLGLRLAEEWNLPDPLPDVIGSHHRQPADHDSLWAVRHVVALSDVVCALLEYSPYVPYNFFVLPCVRSLGLNDDAATRAWLTALPERIAEGMELL